MGPGGVMETDKATRQWLRRNGVKGEIKAVKADADAVYSRVLEFQVGRLEPQIADPEWTTSFLSKKRPELRFTVVIGTCTNGG
jgi:homoaconitase/3-isopropylmalate dehydratase large subunit